MMRPPLVDAIESDFPKCGEKKEEGRGGGPVFGGGTGFHR